MKYYTDVLIKICLFFCLQGFSLQCAQQVSDSMQHDNKEILLSQLVHDLPSLEHGFENLGNHGIAIPSLYDYMHARLIDSIDDENDNFAEKLHEAVCDAERLITLFPILSEGFNLLKEHKIRRNAQEFPTFPEFMQERHRSFNNRSLQDIHRELEYSFKQAHVLMSLCMKARFREEFVKMIQSSKPIETISDPIFRYVIRNSDDFMQYNFLKWIQVYSWGLQQPFLVTATWCHDIELVKKLVKNNNNSIYAENAQGNTALHIASLFNYDEIVEFLLASGADINIKNSMGNTPLHRALMKKNYDIATKLINAGARFDIINSKKHSPLRYAHNSGNKQLEALLLFKRMPEYRA